MEEQRREKMNGPNYWEHPIFLLYWIVLKKKMSLQEWKDMMAEIPKCDGGPIEFTIDFIEKYGTK